MFAVPVPPGKATTRSGSPSTSIRRLRIGPGAVPLPVGRVRGDRHAGELRPFAGQAVGTLRRPVDEYGDGRGRVHRGERVEQEGAVGEVAAAADENAHHTSPAISRRRRHRTAFGVRLSFLAACVSSAIVNTTASSAGVHRR